MSTTVPTSTTWADIVQLIQDQGEQSGLSQDQINAAIAIAKAENGWSGIVGDGGTSYGPFMFHVGGALDSFAKWLGSPNDTSAGWVAVQQPNLAVQFALQPGGYLYNALQNGAAAGNAGADLAMYAEQFGQRAVSSGVLLVGSIWDSLFGKGSAPTQGTGTMDGTTSGITAGTASVSPTPLPKVTDLTSGLSAIGQALANLGTTLGDIPKNIAASALAPLTSSIQVAEQFLWILVGLVLIIVGLWLVVQANQAKVLETILTSREE